MRRSPRPTRSQRFAQIGAWHIVGVIGDQHRVRYGRIGKDGTTKLKQFASADAARAAAEKLIAQKTRKGYSEKLG